MWGSVVRHLRHITVRRVIFRASCAKKKIAHSRRARARTDRQAHTHTHDTTSLRHHCRGTHDTTPRREIHQPTVVLSHTRGMLALRSCALLVVRTCAACFSAFWWCFLICYSFWCCFLICYSGRRILRSSRWVGHQRRTTGQRCGCEPACRRSTDERHTSRKRRGCPICTGRVSAAAKGSFAGPHR